DIHRRHEDLTAGGLGPSRGGVHVGGAEIDPRWDTVIVAVACGHWAAPPRSMCHKHTDWSVSRQQSIYWCMPPRDAAATRRKLLEAGQLEVYLHGFQAAHLDDILRRAGVTKGAFFHHFASKVEFGYALVDD